jgi:hypothetical protein
VQGSNGNSGNKATTAIAITTQIVAKPSLPFALLAINFFPKK